MILLPPIVAGDRVQIVDHPECWARVLEVGAQTYHVEAEIGRPHRRWHSPHFHWELSCPATDTLHREHPTLNEEPRT